MRILICLLMMGSVLGCGRATSLVEGNGDAENAVFSDDGRLFVSGGEKVYEIVSASGGFAAQPIYAGTCNFTGLVVRDGYLYTSCVAGPVGEAPAYLLATPLSAKPELQIIYQY